MKKILIASTALISTAGFAAAEVALSGRAEMGIFQYNAAYGAAKGLANNGDPQFFTDIDVTFTMSGETDNGLTFGASVDLDEGGAISNATQNNSDDGGATIFISGGFGTVTMGDTDGALDWALTDAGNVGNPGSIADDETEHAGYVGAYLDGNNNGSNGDGQILRWDYTSGAFGVAVSLEDDNGSNVANTGIGYAVGFKYSMNVSGTTVNFGLGHQKAADNVGVADDIKATGVSVDATFANGLSAGIQYADWSSVGATGPDSNMGIGLGYTTGAISMHVNYGEVELNNGTKNDGFGIAAAYDLGGGAVVHFGYGQGETAAAPGVKQKSASLGLGLSF
ncbi:porin [Litoreibacter arenae]|uniref:Porin n=1 Tax=Litoreibacter arenae DSM 19593 TaxID=1123360 RepID=S9RI76_9RHOB|nr:porin [Litoreibacter arenae]EPX77805.1 Porin [Litoreibacter arenae DSM 19593]